MLLCRPCKIEDQPDKENAQNHPESQHTGSLGRKGIIVALQVNDNDQKGNDIGDIVLQEGRELYSLAQICLFDKGIPAPAAFSGTEEDINQTAEGKKVVRNNKILQIQDRGSDAQGMKAGKKIVTEGTGHTQKDHEKAGDQNTFFTTPVKKIHAIGNEIFKDGNNRREGSKGHKKKEKSAPDPAAAHLCENIGQGDEDQSRTGSGINAEGKAGRNNDKAGHQCNGSVQNRNGKGFSGKGTILI